MIQALKDSDVKKLKKENLSTLMIWVDGCSACTEAKKEYKEIAKEFKDYKFYEMELKSQGSYEFYSQFVEKKPVKEEATDEDGDVIYDARGNALTRTARDDNGDVILKAPIQVPRFFVFHGESAEEENEYGFLGKVDGHNSEVLKQILSNIVELEKEEVANE